MTPRPILPQGRASALAGGTRPGRPDYDLIACLRSVRTVGDAAVTADEEYDPDFAIKLSNCMTPDDAEALLDEWLQKRVSTLRQTQAELRRVWTEARAHPDERP